MPKRAEVLRRIGRAAKERGMSFIILRQGGNHTIYSLDGLRIPIGRHTEFTGRHAETLYREYEYKLGKGWWR